MLRILIIALLGIALTPNNFCHADTRPNFLVIVSDDQRYDTIDGVMPKTKERIFDSGIQFSKAYITTPACCPSRASILTGQYASRHKVYRNNYKLKGKTLFNFFQKAGYHTGLIGKYLNSWNGRKRPEVDF